MNLAPRRDTLEELARKHGVATEYWSYYGGLERVGDTTLIKVLESMDVPASTQGEAEASLWEAEIAPWRRVFEPCTVVRHGATASITVHVPDGASLAVRVVCEDGAIRALTQLEDFTPARDVEGIYTGQASYLIPDNLPLGYHRLEASIADREWGEGYRPGIGATAHLIVAPEAVPMPSQVRAQRRSETSTRTQAWGAMAQLYSVRSAHSWGVGDIADLRELCSYFASRGGDFLLINPLHAAEPAGHMTPSPYLPVTRRFFNPLYIRPEDVLEYAYLPSTERARVEWAGHKVKEASVSNDVIDRDSAWEAKKRALEIIFAQPLSPSRARAFERYCAREGQGLADFAFWCALREAYPEGFPEEASDPRSEQAEVLRAELAERIRFYMWLQWVMDCQLADAQATAREAGMAFGIAHDLAVGVHPLGADTWALPHMFARNVSVGAPADFYNQQGQNWSQPPWRPDALRECAYAPLRDMARTVLRHAGVLRVDHIMGLFRLWWIPDGLPAHEGTYVYFDHEAMVGVLALEATRAGVVLIGEDLGNVEYWVRDYLSSRGILGTSVLWFEQNEDGSFKRPEQLRRRSLVTVDTHDLPPLAGYIHADHVALREELGVLTEPVADVAREAHREREAMLERLKEEGLLAADFTLDHVRDAWECLEAGEELQRPGEDCFTPAAFGENDEAQAQIQAFSHALHRYMVRSGGELLALALVDGVGERRTQNQPGTNNEYPNWRVPLADRENKLVYADQLDEEAQLSALIDVIEAELSQR